MNRKIQRKERKSTNRKITLCALRWQYILRNQHELLTEDIVGKCAWHARTALCKIPLWV